LLTNLSNMHSSRDRDSCPSYPHQVTAESTQCRFMTAASLVRNMGPIDVSTAIYLKNSVCEESACLCPVCPTLQWRTGFSFDHLPLI
jgi:hypothetical protein